jgi:hypothetical protein
MGYTTFSGPRGSNVAADIPSLMLWRRKATKQRGARYVVWHLTECGVTHRYADGGFPESIHAAVTALRPFDVPLASYAINGDALHGVVRGDYDGPIGDGTGAPQDILMLTGALAEQAKNLSRDSADAIEALFARHAPAPFGAAVVAGAPGEGSPAGGARGW